MASESRGVAAEVFPVERPPPQDPGLMQRVTDWLHAQARGSEGPAPIPPRTRAPQPIPMSPRDPVAYWAGWRAAHVPRPEPWNPLTQDMPDWMKEQVLSGGPIGTGMPGGSMAGWVKGHDFHPVTGMPRWIEAGPGPAQSKLPPGQTQSPATLRGNIEGQPGGWVNVGWLGGEETSTLPGRAASTTAGGQTAKGPGLMESVKLRNEAIPYLQEYGVQGVTYSPLSSGEDVATGGQMGKAGRNKLNEILIGNKSVETGYGPYAIQFREPEFYPKPAWYQGPPAEALLKAKQYREEGWRPKEPSGRGTAGTVDDQLRAAVAAAEARQGRPLSQVEVDAVVRRIDPAQSIPRRSYTPAQQAQQDAAARIRGRRESRRESLNRAESAGQARVAFSPEEVAQFRQVAGRDPVTAEEVQMFLEGRANPALPSRSAFGGTTAQSEFDVRARRIEQLRRGAPPMAQDEIDFPRLLRELRENQ